MSAARKRKRAKSRRTGEGKNISRFSLESIEESSESASPGQRLCHLIGYVEQFILFFPTLSGGGGRKGERQAEWRIAEREKEREERRGENHPPPPPPPIPSVSLRRVPSARTHRRHFPISRQAFACSLDSTRLLYSLLLLRGLPRFFLSLLRSLLAGWGNREDDEARNEKKGVQKERGPGVMVAWPGSEREKERRRGKGVERGWNMGSIVAEERRNEARLGENRTFLHP